MRPDEHKKKKSAQYQKKHSAQKAPAPSVKDARVDQNKKKGATKQLDRNEGASARSGTKSKTLSPTDSEQSDSDVELATLKKTFQRRKIVSNWDKYELAPDTNDIETTPKGEDFSQLLHMAGGAVSQFRFKDEEEWDEAVVSSTADILAVDCDELAAALDCLPLYRRLGLEQELFSETQISEMNTNAVANKEMYKPQQRRACQGETTVTARILTDAEEFVETSDTEMEQSPQANNLSCCLKQSVEDETKKHETTESKGKPVSSDEVVANVTNSKIEKSQTISSATCVTRTDTNIQGPKSKQAEHVPSEKKPIKQNDIETRSKKISIGEQEEELDFLLSLDNPQTDSSDMSEPDTAKKGGNTKTFLGGKTFTDTTTTVSQASQVKKEKLPSTPSEDLENWLDSILDD